MILCPDMKVLDIHTHRCAPYPEGVISSSPGDFIPQREQLYSVGIHPWETAGMLMPPSLAEFRQMASMPQVAAIGECGLDVSRGGPMWVQVKLFRAQAVLAEELGKPLIVHDVKAHGEIIEIRKDIGARMPWIVHGFRGKPTVAEMLLRAGMYLSFGERHNAETLRMVPGDAIFAETDESQLDIHAIIATLSESRGEDLLPVIAANVERILGFPI